MLDVEGELCRCHALKFLGPNFPLLHNSSCISLIIANLSTFRLHRPKCLILSNDKAVMTLDNLKVTNLTGRHLSQAAHLLALASPNVAAHLGRTLVSAFPSSQQNQQTVKHEDLVCLSCGTLVIPGISGKTKTISRRREGLKLSHKVHNVQAALSKNPSLGRSWTDKALRYTCDICTRYQDSNLGVPKRQEWTKRMKRKERVQLPVKRAMRSDTTAKTEPVSSKHAPLPTANDRSRQRAKSRKTGLLKMMEQRKDPSLDSTGGFSGFGLQDFMSPN
jgi:hypothetical protein